MKFLSPLVLEHLGEASKWRLYRELQLQTSDGLGLNIPAGFETDLASIPRPLWSILPPAGSWLLASIFHDWLYENKMFIELGPVEGRKKCDDLFLEAMKDTGVPLVTRTVIYQAVRLGGGKAYRT